MDSRQTKTRANNRGQAQVEFLLCAIVLLTTVVAAFQIIFMVYTYGVMAEAAKQGVRYAVVHGSSSSVTGTTAVQNAVKKYADFPGMTINVTGAGGAPAAVVEVQLIYPFSFLSLGWATPTIRASARGRIFY